MAGSLVEKGLKSPVVPALSLPELKISFSADADKAMLFTGSNAIAEKANILINFSDV